MESPTLVPCPECDRVIRVDGGKLVTHDINRFQRMVCPGSRSEVKVKPKKAPRKKSRRSGAR